MPNNPKKYPIGFKVVTGTRQHSVVEHEVVGLWDDGAYHIKPGVCAGDRWISDQIDCWVETSYGKELQDRHYRRGDYADTREEDKGNRRRRAKTKVRHWLDRVVEAAIEVAATDHPEAVLKNPRTQRSLRKRIAGSISDGLQAKLERGDLFGEEESGTVRCIICNERLQIEDEDAPVTLTDEGRLSNQIVYGGVDCVAFGNYGSSAWDPMGRVPLLGFVLCDPCFRKRRHRMCPIVKEKTDDEEESRDKERASDARAAEHEDQRSDAGAELSDEAPGGGVEEGGGDEDRKREGEAVRGDD